MRNYLMTVAIVAGLGSAGAAFAGDDCRVPRADWQSNDAALAMAQKQGWTGAQIREDDGCYKIEGQDAQGRRIKAKLHPATLSIVEFKYDDDNCRVPMADWQPRDAVQKAAEAQGWIVRRIKTDDGCYEVKGTDAEGHEIEVKFDPATLQLVEFEYGDDVFGPGLTSLPAISAVPAAKAAE